MTALVLLAAACSGGDEDAGGTIAETPASASAVAVASASPATTPPGPSSPSAAPAATTAAGPPPTAPAVVAPADTGVPGLDSGDAFCAAWSRFGGSWQVVLAATAFGDPAEAARLEVIASTVAGDAYEAIFAAWPAELAVEQAVVADQYFGAFQRRSADALAALRSATATDPDVERLAEAWVTALAGRDPSNPVLAVDLPDDLSALADAAAAEFIAARVPLTDDPSMIITAATPRTDEYLATACPDQGAITGQDVVDG